MNHYVRRSLNSHKTANLLIRNKALNRKYFSVCEHFDIILTIYNLFFLLTFKLLLIYRIYSRKFPNFPFSFPLLFRICKMSSIQCISLRTFESSPCPPWLLKDMVGQQDMSMSMSTMVIEGHAWTARYVHVHVQHDYWRTWLDGKICPCPCPPWLLKDMVGR